jgi:hypothetical protein
MGGLTALLLTHQEPGRVLSLVEYGEQNATLSYLAKLAAGDVELAGIPHSGHWPSGAYDEGWGRR